MKIKHALSLLCSTLLLGCSAISGVEPGSNAKEFSENISGNKYTFIIKDPKEITLFKEMHGGFDKDYGLRGLRAIFDPLDTHCYNEGGKLEPVLSSRLPSELLCKKEDRVIWYVKTTYPEFHKYQDTYSTYINASYIEGDLYRETVPLTDRLREKREKEEHLDLLILKNQFAHKASLNKNIGDKVCNERNLFGYVERISKDNIKVAVVGKAINESLYFFFNGEGSKDEVFHYKKVSNPQVWSKSIHWGKCTFDGNN